jgi:hypothetical protein
VENVIMIKERDLSHGHSAIISAKTDKTMVKAFSFEAFGSPAIEKTIS